MGIQSGNFLYPVRLNTRAVRLSRSTPQPLTSGTITPITWDTEDFDNSLIVGSPSAAIVLPEAGLWAFVAFVAFQSNSTGLRRLLLDPNLSGTYPSIDSRPAVSGDNTHITISDTYLAAAGDTLRLNAHQNAGVSLNALAGAHFTAWLIA
ncbi:hypothetical protein ACGFIP_32300 [Micromonospora zamorensis]|uniref:hypothetical protein n=1 Tax=Micromonospora zamorensis TaxID=709883 RepID=UPI00371F42E6